MRRVMMLMVGWIMAILALYLGLLGLELDWNLFDWLPRFDLRAAALLMVLLAALAGTWWLARLSSDRVTRLVSLLACLGLLTLGLYVLPEEPKTPGLFSRQSPSPLWYRGGRFIAMSCPGLFWVAALRRSRRGPHPAAATPGYDKSG